MPRLLAAAGALVIVVSVGGCDGSDEPPVASETPTATPTRTERTGLPPVVSAVPQPDPVAATLGRTATVRGSNLFGTQSATVEVTLGPPKVLPEVKHKNGVVQKPKRGVFVVFDVVIEGVDGTYQFNPLHFHLVPSNEVAKWRGEVAVGLGDRPDSPTSIDALNSIGFGSISAGDKKSGTLVFDLPQAALNNAAVLLRSLLLPNGPASAYWTLA